MNRKILVIDDIREFDGAVHAKTSEAGIEMLISQSWDEVWLDHDLGGKDTIKPVVEYLERFYYPEAKLENLPIIRCISANIASWSLFQGLKNAGYGVYFHWNSTNLPLKRL